MSLLTQSEIMEAMNLMIQKSEKAQEKIKLGTAQYSLLENRIQSLKIGLKVVTDGSETVTKDEIIFARVPIESLRSKSQKARDKMAQDSWQYRMLDKNIKALNQTMELFDKIV